jgi:hypothetical protein
VGRGCKDAKRGVRWTRVACEEVVSGAGHSKRSNGRFALAGEKSQGLAAVNWLTKLE